LADTAEGLSVRSDKEVVEDELDNSLFDEFTVICWDLQNIALPPG